MLRCMSVGRALWWQQRMRCFWRFEYEQGFHHW